MNRKTTVVIGIILVGAVALATLAVLRARSVPVPKANQTPTYANVEFQAATLKRNAKNNSEGLVQISDAIEQSAQSIEADSAESLATIATERIELMIDADIDGWLEEARRYAPETGRLPDGSDDPDYMKKWRSNASSLAGTRVASDGIEVRRIEDPFAFPADRQEPMTIILGSAPEAGGGADYELPEGEEYRAVEVLVPVDYKSSDGGKVPVTLGMRYVILNSTKEWYPVKMYVYMNSEAMGKNFYLPPF